MNFLHKQAYYPGLSVWFSLLQRKFLLHLSQSHFFKEKEGSWVSLQISGIVQEKMFVMQSVFLRLSRSVFHCNSRKSPKTLPEDSSCIQKNYRRKGKMGEKGWKERGKDQWAWSTGTESSLTWAADLTISQKVLKLFLKQNSHTLVQWCFPHHY